MAIEQMEGDPLEGPIQCSFIFYFPKPKSNNTSHHTQRPDLSNIVKTIEDACNGVVWKDDCQIVTMCLSKGWDESGPGHCLMVVEPLLDLPTL